MVRRCGWSSRRLPRHFPAAPWPTALKATSALGTLLLAGLGYGAYRAVPAPIGFTRMFGLGVALVFPAIAVAGLLFAVSGYDVDGGDLYVQRLPWSTRIPLEGLTSLRHDPAACRGSIRIVGNAGLFSFTGLYQSKSLGRYRLSATDLTRSVVLALPRRVVIIMPAAPDAFIEYLHHRFPAAGVGPEDPAA